MIPEEIRIFCESSLGQIKSFQRCSGGCINNGGRIETGSGVFFVKWNSATAYPHMFSKEQRGLELLNQANALTIPGVIQVLEGTTYSCIILEFIESATKRSNYWKQLGLSLAKLHRITAPGFGLDHSNYIGSLEQFNTQCDDWIDFFINQRITVQVRLALENKAMGVSDAKRIEQLFQKLPNLLPAEKPSLIHGDLWSGNIMIDSHGDPALIDPAVSFAHREMDIAMTQLFGSLPDQFYDSYNQTWALDAGWLQRMDIYNLYPLLVHVNLFGGGYLSQVMQIVSRYK